MSDPKPEFQEVGHSGGRVIFRLQTADDGRRSYSMRWEHCRPVPTAIVGLYAIPQGVAVGNIEMGGIGTPWNPPPIPGCFSVVLASDTQGKFGHECPDCQGYWRSGGSVWCCPYCGVRAQRYEFLTEAQRRYVELYCERLRGMFDDGEAELVIDMDAVADAVGTSSEKPPFYYAEESQQHQYACRECGGFNDILGRFGYCTGCGTRNGFQELEGTVLKAIRERINAGDGCEACAKDAVSAFDTFARQYAHQLARRVPLTPRRKSALERMLFHNLEMGAATFKDVFDIDILARVPDDDAGFLKLMFHRRHVYEHNGGEADAKYIADSGDISVRLKQTIRETRETAHRVVGLVAKVASNLHRGFHELFPPNQPALDDHKRRKDVMARDGHG